MSTSLLVENINKLQNENFDAISILLESTCQYLLNLIRRKPNIDINEIKSLLKFKIDTAEEWLKRIEDVKFIESKNHQYTLTPLGEKILSVTDVSIEKLGGTQIPGNENIANKLPDSYILDKKPLGKGATSVTFRGIQKSTGLTRTIKIFRPGIIEFKQLEEFKQRRASIPRDISIPEFIGMGQFKAKLDSFDKEVILFAQVFEYINNDAKTLQEYVGSDSPPYLSRDFFKLFVEHVRGALEAIEKSGLQHGDLHARNILVIQRKERLPAISFKIIDLAGGSSFNSLSFSGINDLEMFKRHLIWCLSEICRKRPGVSARELIGYQVEKVIINLREKKYKNFSELLIDFHKPSIQIPTDYFKEPPKQPFEWLRVEMMPNIEDLYLLFQPDQYVFEALSGTNNVIISGPRGCGKSHYLRSLNFSTEILKIAKNNNRIKNKLDQIGYDYHRFFGVLFECRIGEFKNFIPEATGCKKFKVETIQVLKHILILKIINKTLYILKEGCENEILINPQEIPFFRLFIKNRFNNIPIYGEPNAFQEMIQYSHALITKEKQDESLWNVLDKKWDFLLTEPHLDEFFKAIQQDFPDLINTQFLVLVDDASEGRMHPEMQKILNSIMTSATKRFCFKITCDKGLYTLNTIENRTIDPSQDFIFVDLANLSVKAQKSRTQISDYIKHIVNTRLNRLVTKKTNIIRLLGNSQKPEEFLSLLSSPRKIKKGHKEKLRKKALYAGWNIIFHLSHGSIRTLFQLLNFIFVRCNLDFNDPKQISLEEQDEYVREFSKQKFKSLLMIKGEIEGNPLGNPLSNIANSIGEVSREYLTKWDTGEYGRFYETISVERTDFKPLSEKSAKVLKQLVVFDILVTEGMNFARAQFGISQRYDLNKIYSPCFQITYRVRNHLYLSKSRFEELLLNPEIFVKKTKNRLGNLIKPKKQIQKTLFNGID